MKHFILGLTGASGAIYASRILFHLQKNGHSVSLIETNAGHSVAEFEMESENLKAADKSFSNDDFFSAPASGSSLNDGMVIAPCSMGTLGKIAAGISDNLLTRAADVCLKERRPLVVLVREMPFSLIHLENMAKLTKAGAVVIPASPHFYTRPKTVIELVDTVVAKILTHLGVEQNIIPEWK